jgi:hypothetical protein
MNGKRKGGGNVNNMISDSINGSAIKLVWEATFDSG